MTRTRFVGVGGFARVVGFGPRPLILLLGPLAWGLMVVLHAQGPLPTHLWKDVTADTIGKTAGWTNKVEVADLNGDGRPDLLFANGGNYSDAGTPEMNGAWFNPGPGRPWEDHSREVFGTPGLTRVIKARDLNGDGIVDLIVGNTFQSQSRLYLGTGGGRFKEVTETNLPRQVASIGDIEVGDVDGDGDLDLVLADWGPGNNMTNVGGRVMLWLNDGAGRFADATETRMPDALVRFSWDLELVDVDNDYDLDIVVSCKRCGGGYLFRNDGAGKFADAAGTIPQYTNNYDFEAMDLDEDGFLDLVTINDGDILKEQGSNRREHVFRNDGRGRYRDATALWWPPDQNIGEDDNVAAFLDYDSDGHADFLIGSLSGPDRLMINDGKGRLRVATDVFDGAPTPGTLGLAVADLDGDGRIDVVQAQGENPQALDERVFFGVGLRPDTAPPYVGLVSTWSNASGGFQVRARVHDRKSPAEDFDFKRVGVEWTSPQGPTTTAMKWYGEYLWRAVMPAVFTATTSYRVCATDAAGNTACAAPQR
ncbi:MAG TPA: VCBS repeat-containing protein [Vicinamibacterales bacterium]|nr:VCBS repeat-containing protein [Vicinamibacterales bacterium]